MENKMQCPKCGNFEMGKGKFSGYAKMMPVNKIFSMGSDVIATICINCGHILEMKVTQPEKFVVE